MRNQNAIKTPSDFILCEQSSGAKAVCAQKKTEKKTLTLPIEATS